MTDPLLDMAKEALRPFSECCEHISDSEPDDEWAKFRLVIKNYRDARAAFNKLIDAADTSPVTDSVKVERIAFRELLAREVENDSAFAAALLRRDRPGEELIVSVAQAIRAMEAAHRAASTREPVRSEDGAAAIGQVQWHSSEEDGGPDVGVALQLTSDQTLWAGELVGDESDHPTGLVIYTDTEKPFVMPCEYELARQLVEDFIAPAIRTALKQEDPTA